MIRALEDDFKHVVGIRQVIFETENILLFLAVGFLYLVAVIFLFPSSLIFTIFAAVGIFGYSWLSSCSLMSVVWHFFDSLIFVINSNLISTNGHKVVFNYVAAVILLILRISIVSLVTLCSWFTDLNLQP